MKIMAHHEFVRNFRVKEETEDIVRLKLSQSLRVGKWNGFKTKIKIYFFIGLVNNLYISIIGNLL